MDLLRTWVDIWTSISKKNIKITLLVQISIELQEFQLNFVLKMISVMTINQLKSLSLGMALTYFAPTIEKYRVSSFLTMDMELKQQL